MLKPRRKISFANGRYVIEKAISIEINSGFNKITSTAVIVIPRHLKIDGLNFVVGDDTDIFHVNDQVTIEMGYDKEARNDNLTTRFEGFVTRILPGDNVTIYCEDEMFICKQVNKQTAYSTPLTLVSLVDQMTRDVRTEYAGKGFDFEFNEADVGSRKAAPYTNGDPFGVVCLDATISGFRLKRNPNIAQAIQGLRKNFGFRSFFKNHVLYVGCQWYEDVPGIAPKELVFKFQHNIVDNGKSLEYRRAEDFKMGVKVVSVNQDDNSRYNEHIGEEGGDVKTLHQFHRSGESETSVRSRMVQMGKIELQSRSYTGYYGKFKTFGEPVAEHGDHAVIIDPRHSLDRDGTYKIEHVRTMDSAGGQWQEITLNAKIGTDDFNSNAV